MITLYCYGPVGPLTDFSPYCAKVVMWLDMAGLPYRRTFMPPSRSPNKKLPAVKDDGSLMVESTQIIAALDEKYKTHLDGFLTQEQRAQCTVIHKLLDTRLYDLAVRARWKEQSEWDHQSKALDEFLDHARVPRLARPMVRYFARRSAVAQVNARPVGQMSADAYEAESHSVLKEVDRLVNVDRFVFGDSPCSMDATLAAFIEASIEHPPAGAFHQAANGYPALRTYLTRFKEHIHNA